MANTSGKPTAFPSDPQVEITKDDASSADQLREAFRDLAGDKGYVTKQDLKSANLPPDTVRFLSESMPTVQEGEDPPLGFDCKWHHDSADPRPRILGASLCMAHDANLEVVRTVETR